LTTDFITEGHEAFSSLAPIKSRRPPEQLRRVTGMRPAVPSPTRISRNAYRCDFSLQDLRGNPLKTTFQHEAIKPHADVSGLFARFEQALLVAQDTHAAIIGGGKYLKKRWLYE